ncbi:hypothetical protein FQN57_004971 [Myotisia sp. PD_48]|nr:hypothetical protein FQN57_004971 [Myotisia sp. PD_48]
MDEELAPDATRLLSICTYSPHKPACRMQYILEKGQCGIVADRDLCLGDPILCERAMVMEEHDPTESSLEDYNLRVTVQLQTACQPFVRYFLGLPCELELPVPAMFAARFNRASIPVPYHYEPSFEYPRALTPTGAWLNHACFPNANQTLIRGRVKDPTKEGPLYLAVRAVAPIKEGEEITVAYSHLRTNVDMRREYLYRRWGFDCLCKHCVNPDPEIEKITSLIEAYNPAAELEPALVDNPVLSLQMVGEMFRYNLLVMSYSPFMCSLLEYAAALCGYHSDQARARAFLKAVSGMYAILQGMRGDGVRRARELEKDVTKLKGFGRTKNWLSSREDYFKIGRLDEIGAVIAFMLDDFDGEYLSLDGLPFRDEDDVSDDDPGTYAQIREKEEGAKEKPHFEVADDLIEELEREKQEHDKSRQENKPGGQQKSKKKKNKKNKKKKK